MTDIAGELTAAALHWPMQDARLVRLVASGRCPKSLLKKLAARMCAYARLFTGDLAQLAHLATSPRIKLFLVENLLEESGARMVPGEGLHFDAQAVHLNWARSFALACGLDHKALQEGIASGPAIDHGWFGRRLQEGDWLGGTAYLLAQEFNTPRTLAPMLRGLSAMGFHPGDLTFFTAHIMSDDPHGHAGMALLAQEITSTGARDRVLSGIERGAFDWWQAHN